MLSNYKSIFTNGGTEPRRDLSKAQTSDLIFSAPLMKAFMKFDSYFSSLKTQDNQ